MAITKIAKMKLRITVVLILTTFTIVLAQQKTNNPSKSLNIPQDDVLNFYVIGDWGRYGGHHQAEVATQMDKYAAQFDPEFIISTGDNFYTNGVASTQDPQWNLSFESIYNKGGITCLWYPILGNHDYLGNPQAQIDYSKISRKWSMPDRYYTNVQKIDKNTTARFVYIDTNPFVERYHKANKYSDLALQDTAKQWKWIDSVLANSKEDWKIVVGHHPVYSSSKKHGGQPELQKKLIPLLEKYGVQMYFCGHDHDLQYQKPEGSKVDYIVSGAGSETRDMGIDKNTIFAKDISGYVAVSLTNNKAILYFIDYKGNVIYNFTRVK